MSLHMYIIRLCIVLNGSLLLRLLVGKDDLDKLGGAEV